MSCLLAPCSPAGITAVGAFKTVQVGVPYNFSFLFGSCAWSGSTTPVFTRMKDLENMDIYLQFGDLHYADIIVDDEAVRNKSFTDLFDSKVQAALFLEQPIAYMWDDHDFGANDADGLNPSKPTAMYVPGLVGLWRILCTFGGVDCAPAPHSRPAPCAS